MAQLAILYSQSEWTEALAVGLGAVALLAAFAYTRLKWDSHVDMFLAMTGPGGLGMLVGGMLSGESCHDAGWSSFLWMSAGMSIASAPLCWYRARCLQEARAQGRGVWALSLDWTGMQAGMVLGHLPAMFVHLPDARAAWLHHGVMLVAMSLGMLAAAAIQSNSWNSGRPEAKVTREGTDHSVPNEDNPGNRKLDRGQNSLSPPIAR